MHSTLLLEINFSCFKYGTITLSGVMFQKTSSHKKTYNQHHNSNYLTVVDSACPDPLLIASYWGITIVFFSSGYLDDSVHRVPLHC